MIIQPLQSPNPSGKRTFNDVQLASLNVLMDLLIPASPDRRMPAASDLALFANVADMPSKDRLLIEAGLAELDARSVRRHQLSYARLQQADARALVEELRSEGSAFIQAFMTQTVGRYLAHDVVMPLIGLEPRAPWPKGNQVAQGDWSLLDVVKQRPKIYRPV